MKLWIPTSGNIGVTARRELHHLAMRILHNLLRRDSLKKRFLPLLLFAATLTLNALAQPPKSPPLWITDVFLVSPENLQHIDKGSVLVEDGIIRRVVRNSHAKKPTGAVVLSGKEGYLTPGLIDSHVHLASVPGMQFDQAGTHAELVGEYLNQQPRSYLYFGYTTLIDLAVFDPQVMRDFRNADLHPDLYDCGQSIPIANGYPMSFAPPSMRFKIFPNFLYDPQQADKIPHEYAAEEHTAAADVARVKSSGGVCVKSYYERGFGADKNLPVMPPELLAQLHNAAAENHLPLMMHANSLEAQRFAMHGGVDVIAHGLWNWNEYNQQTEMPEAIAKLLDQIAEQKIGYQPTIQVLYGEMAYFDSGYLKQTSIRKVVPQKMAAWFHTPEGRWYGKALNPEVKTDAEFYRDEERGPVRRVQKVVAYLANKDANFLFGTDTPSSPTYGNLPGLNGYLEMQQLHRAGMSLEQIFRAATINNARAFHLDAKVGSIEEGKTANLVLMRHSPLQSIKAYDSISAVWIHGRMIARKALAADANH